MWIVCFFLLLLCGVNIPPLSIHSPVEHLGCLQCLDITNKEAMNIHVTFLCVDTYFHFSWIDTFLTFKEAITLVSKVVVQHAPQY